MMFVSKLQSKTELRLRLQSCLLLVVGIAFLGSVGCQSSNNSLPNLASATTSTTLSAGDTIKLTFSGANELSQSQKIRADGKVNLPLVGEVVASGKTIAQLQKDLTALYKPQLRNSTVVVTLESG